MSSELLYVFIHQQTDTQTLLLSLTKMWLAVLGPALGLGNWARTCPPPVSAAGCILQDDVMEG